MWETFKTWFLANQDDILVPVVSGLILVFAIGLWKFFTKPQDEPAQPITLPTTDAEMAKELGVTEAALRNFFKILQENHVGADELDAKLREIAQRHKDLLERVAAIPDVDERANGLRDDAQAAIADGRYDDADEILRTAENQDLQAAAELEDQLHSRKMAVSASTFARGDLAFSRFKYQNAASHFLRAAEHTPQSEPRTQIEAFTMSGRAFAEAAEFQRCETAYAKALTAAETQLGQNDPLTATVLNNLAALYKGTNRMDQAEPLMERALAIDEKAFSVDHPNVAIRLNNLATLYQATNRMEQAEPLMERALAIDEKTFGPEHPEVATDLNNLAQLYKATNRIAQAEPLMERALAIDEKAFGAEHPEVATDLNNLAALYQATNRMEQAEPLMMRALTIDEKAFGAEHPNIAIRLNNLAQLYQDTNRIAQAEPLMERALAIDEKAFGTDHPDVAIDLSNLAGLYLATNRIAQAEPLFVRAAGIFTASLGVEHPNTLTVAGNLEILRQEMAQRGD